MTFFLMSRTSVCSISLIIFFRKSGSFGSSTSASRKRSILPDESWAELFRAFILPILSLLIMSFTLSNCLVLSRKRWSGSSMVTRISLATCCWASLSSRSGNCFDSL